VYAFLGPQSGGYAEYAVARVSELALKPRTLDHAHAAAVPLAATTAWQALFDQGKLQPGERVLIHGAAGGVGHFAVQFAKACGSSVVATASGEDIGMLKELGADEVIDYKHERFEDEARDIDLVLDLVAGETQERSWSVLKDGGRMVSTLAQPSEEKAAAHHANGVVFMARPRGDELTEISRLIDNGEVSVIVSAKLPLGEARIAHEKLEHEHTRGKLVLTVA
jgi:NADPH:quinone reductase-like Zn-dependent oxidoreductase